MKLQNIFSIFCFLFLASFVNLAVIEHEDVKNSKNVIEFTVIHGNTVEVPNNHRTRNPKLKFSLQSTRIEKIIKLPSNLTQSGNWALRLEDQSSLEIAVKNVNIEPNIITEYSILWHGDHHRADRELCLHYPKNSKDTFWYQGYVSNDSHWPMDPHFGIGKVQFNSMMELERYSIPTAATGLTREFQFILEHFFLNSDGFGVHLDHRQPLFIRRDPINGGAQNPDALICFSTQIDNSYYHKRNLKAPADLDLKIKFFSAKNTRIVTDYVVHHSGYIPKPTALPRDLSLISIPFFTSDAIFDLAHAGLNVFNEANIAAYAANITQKYALTPKAEFLIERFNWLKYSHEYDIDELVFPNVTTFADSLAAKGVRLGGVIAGPEMPVVGKEAQKKLGKYNLHTPTNYTTWTMDFTNPETVKFYSTLLTKVHKSYKIATFWLKSFIFWNGECDFHDPEVSRFNSLYVPAYIEAAAKASEATVVTEMAYRSQHLPVFTRLIEYYPTSEAQMLRELIPSVLSASISGYSFLLPFPAGTFNDIFKFKFVKPSEELYIRMVQATTFMMAQSFTRPPWNYTQKAVDLTRKFIKVHADHVDTIVAIARKRITDGNPVLRPIWYNYPDEVAAYKVGDQFMLGEDILVAPVVVEGQRERMVYIPSGVWVDQHGKEFKGPVEVKVLAPLEELPYFKRKK